MKKIKILGVPYEEKDIKDAKKNTNDKTEQDALIAYLQVLGQKIKNTY
jgi:cytochrome c oxidase cbb3-type subunit 2